MRTIKPGAVGFPKLYQPKKHVLAREESASLLDLGAFATVRSILEAAQREITPRHHVFLVAEERTESLPATLAWLKQVMVEKGAANDWVYLYNFQNSAAPQAFAVAPGMGIMLKNHVSVMIEHASKTIWQQAQNDPDLHAIHAQALELDRAMRNQVLSLSAQAEAAGLHLNQSESGRLSLVMDSNKLSACARVPDTDVGQQPDDHARGQTWQMLNTSLHDLQKQAVVDADRLAEKFSVARRVIIERILKPLCGQLKAKFHEVAHLSHWIDDFQDDFARHMEADLAGVTTSQMQSHLWQERYAVNVLVDRTGHRSPPLECLTEINYEKLFGVMPYVQTSNGFHTNHTLIRPGALHRANGGVLVMRAEALVQQPEAWAKLKAALRDRVILIEEFHRATSLPTLQAPKPDAIPLDIQVIIVGGAWWYHHFFEADTQMRALFKWRAEVDPDMPATSENIAIMASLLQARAGSFGAVCNPQALDALVGYAASLSGQRTHLSSQIGYCYDVLDEAISLASEAKQRLPKPAVRIDGQSITKVLALRRERRSGALSRHIDDIVTGRVHIATDGVAVGQINGLTVNLGPDTMYGTPVRITARTFAAKSGVVNIERDIDMSGPIQKKGIMTLSAFLNAEFGQDGVISFGCSLTFEQNYVMIDGDSASLAELLTILSALSEIPIYQNLAVTGSLDQMGRVQSIGGLRAKIEGFFALCARRGLSGKHGIVCPEDNCADIMLPEFIQKAMQQDQFHITVVSSVAEAVAVMFDVPDTIKRKKPAAIYDYVRDKIRQKLKRYTTVLNSEGHTED